MQERVEETGSEALTMTCPLTNPSAEVAAPPEHWIQFTFPSVLLCFIPISAD